MTEQQHSDLGGSGAKRWLNCPGSVTISRKLPPPPEDKQDPDYTLDGRAVHAALAFCLGCGKDAWEAFDREWEGRPLKADAAAPMQIYLDYVRQRIDELRAEFGKVLVVVEWKFHRPEFHHLFFGTADCMLLAGDFCEVIDYKHGVGQFVDERDNDQTKYYGVEALFANPDVVNLRLTIVQPRVEWADNPVRSWDISAIDLHHWKDEVLQPGMELADTPNAYFEAGDWCRFCPANATLTCPLLEANFDEIVSIDPDTIPLASDEQLGKWYAKLDTLMMRRRAIERTLSERIYRGVEFPGVAKLVPGKANRQWRDPAAAQQTLHEIFGDAIFTAPAFKTPAAVEALGGSAKARVKELAYTPPTDLVVAPWSDNRKAQRAVSGAEKFAEKYAAHVKSS